AQFRHRGRGRRPVGRVPHAAGPRQRFWQRCGVALPCGAGGCLAGGGVAALAGRSRPGLKSAPMTRINCVPVQELSGPHLVAEYRELPRVFALARKAAARGVVEPTACYTLGKGHLRFFYTRLGYLVRRHAELIAEMKRRGYKPTFEGVTRQQFPELSDGFWHDWQSTPEALQLNRERIAARSGARLGDSAIQR